MPRLACWSCGRQIYTVSPIEALFAEERRCPRCGAYLNAERRESFDRRARMRRQNPPDDPGPPGADGERRSGERRQSRRRSGDSALGQGGPGEGWVD